MIAWTIALLSPVPTETAEELLGNQRNIFIFGKMLHVCVYAFLMVFGGTVWFMTKNYSWLVVVLVNHGIVTEYFQQFVGRTSSARDAMLDSIGVTLGTVLVALYWRYRGANQPMSSPASASPEPLDVR